MLFSLSLISLYFINSSLTIQFIYQIKKEKNQFKFDIEKKQCKKIKTLITSASSEDFSSHFDTFMFINVIWYRIEKMVYRMQHKLLHRVLIGSFSISMHFSSFCHIYKLEYLCTCSRSCSWDLFTIHIARNVQYQSINNFYSMKKKRNNFSPRSGIAI